MDILVYGGGMLGRQVAHLVLNHFPDRYRLYGFIDDVKVPGVKVIDDIATLGTLDSVCSQKRFSPDTTLILFAIGYSDMHARSAALARARSKGYRLVGLVHPAASVDPSAKLGDGVIILAGAVVDQYVTIGDASYLHNGAIVGENSILGANNYLSAGTTLGGSVTVGENNFFGINSTVVNDITIGNNSFVNAASLVYKSVGDNIRVVEYREQREVRFP